jgi:predicted Rdx family selenoprotein
MADQEVKQLGFDEVIDTLADVIETGDDIVKVFADGFQPLSDLIALAPQFGRVQEIIADAPTAWAQFKDLDVDEANQVQQALADRLDLSSEEVTEKFVGSFKILSKVYRLLDHVLNEFLEIKLDIETLLD